MARPRTFDPDDVLNTALDIFWRKGFRGTSLDDITAESGLAKPSLYAAFGDKNALFLKVLDRYHDGIIARTGKLLARNSSARDAISDWLESFVPYCSGSKGARGCLSINNATELPADQADLLASVERYNARLEDLIRRRLETDRDQFSKDFNPKAAAYFIITLYNGLMVMARQAPSAANVRAAIRTAISSLD
ncbi:MAG: TetR/AcrR family transcriptional regulator [Candidatus Afipia apatlaquensis]|uniref:TetR/AcrR family transcriptional regulator n=1 Tax=Candidatus Afipia apatlaquensis TaxID=2712852 RepID=A0A7C9RDC7_9BRAD|nr:TetR/AcrR family transcriptional regulator [Candidatus Afipia apatlaquensis]